jgi:adenylyltransferase/sulfurtransferase
MNSKNNPEELPELSSLEKTRYSRHLILPEVGTAGQRRLKAARVLIIGAGGLGAPAAIYLAAAGIGTIGIVDFDNIELSNLQRQIIHSTADVGSSKCKSAKSRLAQINPEIKVVLYEERITAENIEKLVEEYDVIVDATDNFTTRYLINDACVLGKKPNVFGAIYRFEGQTSIFAPGGPCYRCLFPYPPPPDAVPNCAEGGVLGVLAGMIGVIQATEAIKYILGMGKNLVGQLLMYDALDMKFDVLKIARNAKCPLCGDNPTILTVEESTISCKTAVIANGANLSNDVANGVAAITAPELQRRLANGESIFLLDVRNSEEYQLCRLPGSVLIPLRDLPARVGELNRSRELVVYCKSGSRGLKAAQLLLSQGFSQVKNLKGGILSWIAEIDPTMRKY